MLPIKDDIPPFLNQFELAKRWRISEKTLERWRYEKKQPSFVKIHGRILYRREDILEFERLCVRKNTFLCDLSNESE